MALPQPAPKAKFFMGVMYADKKLCENAVREIVNKFGPVEHESDEYDFTDFTAYYEDEMGDEIKKKFLVFKKPMGRDRLADIKLWTNALEDRFAKKSKRRINIDPGYITPHNLVLASAKDRAHKIYLGKGIYADLTLLFSKHGCEHFSHTFPDFKTKEVQDFFCRIRNQLKNQK